MPFKKLEIIEPILKAIESEGYIKPSDIQEQAIPVLLNHKDMMGSAQTGTGKTAAFAIPILQNIMEKNQRDGIKALILTPTRELAMQIKESFDNYGKYLPLKTVVIYGGVKQKSQTDKLRRKCDILVATPGRLLDLMNQKFVHLDKIDYFVLDEADRMLDMGFIKDVREVVAKIPGTRQTMLFSATLPKSILSLARTILTDPVRIQITPEEATLDAIQQKLYYVKNKKKSKLLINLLNNNDYDSVLVFTRTKRNADTVMKHLTEKNILTVVFHGNKSQAERTRSLDAFKQKRARVLVATDVASRGIDIDGLSLVVNYHLPEQAETYIHRIGRTGRAEKKGIALSFCSPEELSFLKDIQKHIQMVIPVEDNNPYYEMFTEEDAVKKQAPKPSQNQIGKSTRRNKSKPTHKNKFKQTENKFISGKTSKFQSKKSNSSRTKSHSHNQ